MENPRICVTALVGLPAAGKTTLCQQLLHDKQLSFNIVHISYDDLFPYKLYETSEREATSSTSSFKSERLKSLSLIETVVSSIKEKGIDQLPDLNHKISQSSQNSTDCVILFDDNNFYSSMRYKIYQICRKHQVFFAQIYFPPNLESSQQRNSQRPKSTQVPEKIIKEMAKRFELPNKNKNLWESNTFSIEGNTTDGRHHLLTEVLKLKFSKFIANIFQSTPPTLSPAISKQENTSTILHHLDVMLRRRIKEILRDLHPANAFTKKDEAKRLNDKRRELLRIYSKRLEKENLSLNNLNEICTLMQKQ